MSFFTKPIGRKIATAAAGATVFGLALGNYLPHTIALDKYVDFVTCYENGMPRPVSETLKKRVEKAMDILQISAHERKFVKPFTVFGFDLFGAGATHFRFGAAVGIPVNYNYSSVEEAGLNEIRFRDQTINWDSQYGTLLKEAIILTEEEQIFGLCKTLLQLQTQRVLMNTVFPTLSFITVYTVGRFLNMRLNLYARPLSLRLIMYSILGTFGVGSWFFMKDFSQVRYDTEIDKKLASLGPEFVAAGVGYYDKVLKKNMALRALIGDDTYTAKGNENYLLRQKAMPITLRKSYFEHKWKELQQTVEDTELLK